MSIINFIVNNFELNLRNVFVAHYILGFGLELKGFPGVTSAYRSENR